MQWSFLRMAIRVFTCRECGHKMRLGGRACGYCHADKLPWQSGVLVVGGVLVALCAVLAEMVMLLT